MAELEQIRKIREKIASKKTLTLKVPGYEGHVLVRYKYVPQEHMEQWADRVAEDNPKVRDAGMDMLIECCDEILVRQTPESEDEPIQEGVVTTFRSGTLHELLGYEASSAREEVSGLFSPEGTQPLAFYSHVEALSHWLQGSKGEIDRTLLGN